MGVLSDRAIRELAQTRAMITPFAEEGRRDGVISYGVSSYGYDFRVAGDFEVFSTGYAEEHFCTDPKKFRADAVTKVTLKEGVPLHLPPHSFALGVSVERFVIPRDIITICLGKSTYARCGLYVNITPFEPEWQGYATVELTNPTPRVIKVYPFEGIAQLIFLQAGIDHAQFAKHVAHLAMDIPLPLADALYPFGNAAPPPPPDGRLLCERSYADKGGKYQGQENRVVHPKVDKQ